MKKNLFTTPYIVGAIGLVVAVIAILVIASIGYSDAPAGAPVVAPAVVAPATEPLVTAPATAP